MLPLMRAAIGSTNPAKVAAVREALATLAPECEVVPIEVPSGVGHHPFGDVATRSGALARARKALTASGADTAFGLDGAGEVAGEAVLQSLGVVLIHPVAREGH